MIDVIVRLIAYMVIIPMSIIIYVLLVSGVYPRLTMKWKSNRKMRDRGLQKYIFPGGRSVVCEPELKMRKYIKQYVLLCQDGNKYIKCFVNKSLRFMKYDVLAFDNRNELIDVIMVSEKLSGGEYSKAVPLPEATSYVSVVLRKADKMYFDGDVAVGYSKRGMAILASLITVTTVIESFVLQKGAEAIWDCFYRPQTFVDERAIFVRALIAGVVCSAVVLLSYYLRAKKVTNK